MHIGQLSNKSALEKQEEEQETAEIPYHPIQK
jgi:hypothetical protein